MKTDRFYSLDELAEVHWRRFGMEYTRINFTSHFWGWGISYHAIDDQKALRIFGWLVWARVGSVWKLWPGYF